MRKREREGVRKEERERVRKEERENCKSRNRTTVSIIFWVKDQSPGFLTFPKSWFRGGSGLEIEISDGRKRVLKISNVS